MTTERMAVREDGRPSICLTMIVKDESAVIERCLASVLPLIDSWCIVDTGSSDDTCEKIRAALRHLPGELHERAWKNFGHNRTEAFTLARRWGDYSLVIDADETMEIPEGFEWPELKADGYFTLHRSSTSSVSFDRLQLMKTSMTWRYEGVLHEVAVCDDGAQTARVAGVLCLGHFDSARNQGDVKDKYARDAAVLAKALDKEPNNARYWYYLARSYRDAGMLDKALEAFAKRADLGGWEEEVWHSLHEMGVIAAGLGKFHAAVMAQLEAHQYRPQRAEPLCALARLYRTREEYHLAYVFAQQAARISRPDDRLFIDDSVYRWRALDELSIAAYWAGEYEESLQAARSLLAGDALPSEHRPRVEKNRRFAEEKLGLRTKAAPALPDVGRRPVATPVAGPGLLQLLPLERPIRILDVGASPVDGAPPYQPLVDGSLTEVIGFEPNPEARAALEAQLNENETVLGDALGDGGEHTLHFCQAPGMNSLFEPDPSVLEKFNLFGEFGTVLKTEKIRTKRLDDLEAVGVIDFVKLDVQGFEKTIIEHGKQRLGQALAIHTEVAFVPMYRKQPCFGEVDVLLRDLGFVTHTIYSAKRWGVAPLVLNGNPRKGTNQLLDGDIVYARDFFDLQGWDNQALIRMVHIVHFTYGSYDLAHYLVRELVRRQAVAPELPQRYLELAGLR